MLSAEYFLLSNCTSVWCTLFGQSDKTKCYSVPSEYEGSLNLLHPQSTEWPLLYWMLYCTPWPLIKLWAQPDHG